MRLRGGGRLGLSSLTERPDFERERRPMSDAMALGFAASGALGLVAIALPVPDSLDRLATGAIAAGALLLGAAVAGLQGRLPLPAYHLLVLLATAMVTASIAAHGSPANDNELLYVFIGVYAFYFFAVIEAIAHLLVIIVAYGWVSAWIGASVEPTAILLVAGTTATVGALARYLGYRARALVGELSEQATTDHLTGLLNRRALQRLVEAELVRAARSRRGFCLVIGDLDHFKRVNDSLGHMGGDMALERVGAVLQRSRRASDSVARIGGEEFAVLLPECDERGARIAAERLREAIAAAFSAGPAELTISLGAAAYPRHGSSWEELLHAADKALYAAKDAGRNRTVVYGEDLDAGRAPA